MSNSVLSLICISCLVGGVFAVPLKGFGSKNPSPTLTDYSGSQGGVAYRGEDDPVYVSGSTSQEGDAGPLTWFPMSGDSDAAKGGLDSNGGYSSNDGNPAWANNEGQDSGANDPIPDWAQGSSEDPEEDGPVLSDVSDLEPVYSFSSRSRYQQASNSFVQSRYTPGEVWVPFPSRPVAKYEPVLPGSPGKGSTKAGY
ncbi:hypothetical protein NHX12_031926 [Muraenolepis orangiensis]|uniref:Uncharacterized protein n=1 Tax=Muraenolepis orangiensis TaxID=630683 RepID=A0A9Q0E6T5_9TELE|nr:hypothetical protein NHX12_031926 [Muraenolepis orangiensis]